LTERKDINEYLVLPILDGIEVLRAKNCTVRFPWHKHETYNISLVIKNTFTTELVAQTLAAPVGTIAITNPNELHATPCDHEMGNTFFTFYIPVPIIEQIAQDKNVVFVDKVVMDPILFNAFLSIAQGIFHGHENIEQRLIGVLRSLIQNHQTTSLTLESSDNAMRQFIYEIIEKGDFSLDQIGTQYGINKFKFIRLFKQETGLTPKRFLMLKKIEQSKTMLRAGYPIFDVAIECGFYDSSHFYKYFKQYTGVNPFDFQSAFK